MSTTRRKGTPAKKTGPAVRRRSRSQKLSPAVIIGMALVGAAILLIGIAAANRSARTNARIEGLLVFPNQERGHTNGTVEYAQVPPVGGEHNPAWQNCGVYSQPVNNENAVHSLEHGAIWITYQPDLPASELEELQRLTRQSGYRLLSPYPDLPAPIVASAWGYQVQLERADDPRLTQFIRLYEQNPLGPEPGASCTGGVGIPG